MNINNIQIMTGTKFVTTANIKFFINRTYFSTISPRAILGFYFLQHMDKNPL